MYIYIYIVAHTHTPIFEYIVRYIHLKKYTDNNTHIYIYLCTNIRAYIY